MVNVKIISGTTAAGKARKAGEIVPVSEHEAKTLVAFKMATTDLGGRNDRDDTDHDFGVETPTRDELEKLSSKELDKLAKIRNVEFPRKAKESDKVDLLLASYESVQLTQD